jgi:hypothetical protein
MCRRHFILITLFLFGLKSQSATCVSSGSGTWTNTATWSCGSVPTCGNSVVIQAGHTVSITAVNLSGCALKFALVIKGTLRFITGGSLQLSCSGKVYIYAGGQIVPNGGGSSNTIIQCGSTWWNAAVGTYNGPGCMPPGAACSAQILPVTLAYFEGKNCGSNFCLTWGTLEEHNHSHFDLERSTDGESFEQLARFAAAANYYGQLYNWTDQAAQRKVYYYRLKQVDLDGTFSFSHLVASGAAEDAAPKRHILPNPNNGNFSVERIIDGVTTHISILDDKGQLVFQQSFTGDELVEVSMKGRLNPGLHVCRISQGAHFQSLKFIVASTH